MTPDETGWKVGGRLWWMWAFCSENLTVYSIQPGRGYEQAIAVLGADFDGLLSCVTDGSFTKVLLAPSIRPAWRISCGAVGKCWKWPGPGRRSCHAR